MLNNIVKSPVVLFLVFRYFSYAIHFLNSMVIAKILGPEAFGVWAFVLLVVQSYGIVNLGIPNSISVLGASKKGEKQDVSELYSNALGVTLLTASISFISFIVIKSYILIDVSVQLEDYLYWCVVVTVVFAVWNASVSNILRLENRLGVIAASYFVQPILLFIVCFVAASEDVLSYLVVGVAIAQVLIAVLFYFRNDIFFCVKFDRAESARILGNSGFLLLYNSAFYLMLIFTRYAAGIGYSLSGFGAFSFSFTFVNLYVLFLGGIRYVAFPKILKELASKDDASALNMIAKLREGYLFLSHLLMHLSFLFFSAVMLFFPEYSGAQFDFGILMLAVVIHSGGFGYQGLILSRKMYRLISFYALISMLLNVVLLILFDYLEKPKYVSVTVMFSYGLFTFLCVRAGRSIFGMSMDVLEVFSDMFPLSMFVPWVVALLITLIGLYGYIYLVSLILFVLFNIRRGRSSYTTALGVLSNHDSVKI